MPILKAPIYHSAAEVEAAFYDALSRADLETMTSLWSEHDEVVCIHPDGARLVGLPAITAGWKQIFQGDTRLVVRTSGLVAHSNVLIAVHNLFEHVSVEGSDRLYPPHVASNVYVRGSHGWRMVMHHATATPDIANLTDEVGPHGFH